MRDKKKALRIISADKWQAGGIAAALVAAAAVFAIMLQLEKNALMQYERGTVYTAAVEIPMGQLITGEELEAYCREIQLDKSCIPGTALRRPEDAEGLAALFDIEPGVILTDGMFEKKSEVLENMREPVIAGFRADDLSQVAGGVLRAGDRIHVYCVSEDDGAQLIWDDLYIQGVFDQTGARIANGDTRTAAQRINVYMDKSDVETFYTKLASGTLRVVKVCR